MIKELSIGGINLRNPISTNYLYCEDDILKDYLEDFIKIIKNEKGPNRCEYKIRFKVRNYRAVTFEYVFNRYKLPDGTEHYDEALYYIDIEKNYYKTIYTVVDHKLTFYFFDTNLNKLVKPKERTTHFNLSHSKYLNRLAKRNNMEFYKEEFPANDMPYNVKYTFDLPDKLKDKNLLYTLSRGNDRYSIIYNIYRYLTENILIIDEPIDYKYYSNFVDDLKQVFIFDIFDVLDDMDIIELIDMFNKQKITKQTNNARLFFTTNSIDELQNISYNGNLIIT